MTVVGVIVTLGSVLVNVAWLNMISPNVPLTLIFSKSIASETLPKTCVLVSVIVLEGSSALTRTGENSEKLSATSTTKMDKTIFFICHLFTLGKRFP